MSLAKTEELQRQLITTKVKLLKKLCDAMDAIQSPTNADDLKKLVDASRVFLAMAEKGVEPYEPDEIERPTKKTLSDALSQIKKLKQVDEEDDDATDKDGGEGATEDAEVKG